jgi:hypothetical protein
MVTVYMRLHSAERFISAGKYFSVRWRGEGMIGRGKRGGVDPWDYFLNLSIDIIYQ